MRRKDKEIAGRARLEKILDRARVCRLAMTADGPQGPIPYVVPVFFACRDGRLYVHCAEEGRKLDLVGRNPRVCVEVDEVRGILPAEKPCAFSSVFRSVIASGTAARVQDAGAKREALDLLMAKYAGRRTGPGFEFSDATLEHTAVLEITIEQITGKQSQSWEEGGEE
jgi:nitroimidazol reductase NimA-like FMN-containing flavoprotein (pyridoxamine 5'-phosphate oxidase superfamily)